MLAPRKLRIPVQYYYVKPFSPEREDSTDDADRRRRFGATELNSKCSCILQIITGLMLIALLAIAVIVPFMVIQKQQISTTILTTTPTTLTTTSLTSITSATTTTASSSTSTSTSTSTTITTSTTVTTTTITSSTTACYFGDDYVDLVQGGRRRISGLKVEDRVWTLSNDGERLIEDEIFSIPHAGPNTLTYFYTFTTIEGYRISVTGSHYIVVVDKGEKKMKIIRASKVTLEHQLIITGRTIDLAKIVYSQRIGFYSPITLSGYLLVNNISTSVYVDCLQATHHFFHLITAPFRIYYRITRWLFGNDYNPFAMNVETEIHPISTFIMTNYEFIRLFFTILYPVIPIISIVLVSYLTQRFVFYKTDHYYYYRYQKMKHQIDK